MEFIFVFAGILVLGVILFKITLKVKSNKPEELLPFKLKNDFFSQSEFVFFGTLVEELDISRFRILSKVRMADFIETTARGKEFYSWFNKIKSKHIDFIIWDTKKNKIALGIELDGTSHGSQKMLARDDFVNRLYEQLNFPIKRIGVGTKFKDEVKVIRTLIETE